MTVLVSPHVLGRCLCRQTSDSYDENATRGASYLRNLLVVLSARILPPVWQVGQ
jgi:hypothetical protein